MSTTIRLKQASVPVRAPRPDRISTSRASWLDRSARSLLVRNLRGLQGGTLELVDGTGSMRLGSDGDLSATMTVHSPTFYRHAVMGGTLSVAESYLRGDWDCDDLTSLFRLFVRNIATAQGLDDGLSRFTGLMNRMYHRWHANSRTGSRRNIHAHYDLGNDFFRLMLDETMAYSSGIFASPTSSLHDASVEKMDRLCRLLKLNESDHLLEIGTGWGGLALHAAEQYGCHVTTTTISRQQHEVAAQRIADAGLQDQVTLLMSDYRDLGGRYDKIVSVEMIEAVGHQYLGPYFAKCASLLKPGGLFALQSIVMPDAGYDRYLRSVDFIQKYVFPGGCLPSLAAMRHSSSTASDLRIEQSDDFGLHYARTIREWRTRFHARLDDVRAIGCTERFIRLWDYYLCYCEAAFDERYTGLVQMLLSRPS